ncbi:hypothetical protein B0J18DRAFT_464773 [Chaetomium sp. MPI-SDFR-AT-0129]|nr:hypothetical protein B0J18DRAFT_464773 [Chaetomium sp. MPI-SDFR-AT-0129]
MGKLPTTLLRRPSLGGCLTSVSPSHSASASLASRHTTVLAPGPIPSAARHQQVRHATFVPRSRRPYQFTQLVQLSDGSTYTMRTTSPIALYKSGKDSRNHLLWQPTEKSLRNVEVDEAGKLAAFRDRFGSGWDADAPPAEAADSAPKDGDKAAAGGAEGKKAPAEPEADPFDSLVDLISAYATEDKNIKGGLSAKDQAKKDKKKK